MVHNSLIIVPGEEFIASQSGRSIHGVGIIIAATSATRLKENLISSANSDTLVNFSVIGITERNILF